MEAQTVQILLPFLIFFARIIDVSIGTIRVIFVSKGFKYLAPFLGFFEVLVWIIVVSKIMTGATHMIFYIAYAAGFATGTFVGMKLEERLSIGKVMIRIITQKNSTELIEELMKSNHSITVADAQGKKGEVKIIFSVIDKKELKKITALVHKYNPKAFYSIEDIRYANEAILPRKKLFSLGRKFK